jgi:hypothetical protein
MNERRKEHRYQCFARIKSETDAFFGHLCDISPGGFKVLVPASAVVVTKSAGRFLVSLSDADIPPFVVTAELKWSMAEGKMTLLGFERIGFDSAAGENSFARILESFKVE